MPSPAAEEDGQDPFKRLPDDLLISHIFDKISETKSLSRCSLVSKHFYSLVYQTRNAFLKIPLQVSDDDGLNQFRDFTRRFSLAGRKGIHIITIPLEFFFHGHGSRPPPSPTPIVSQNQFLSRPSTKYLRKFKSIKSLQVEFHCCGSQNEQLQQQQPVVKWKIDKKSAKYILVLAPPTAPSPAGLAATEIGSLMKVQFGCHLDIACLTFSLMESLLPLLPESLQHVIFTDSEKRGRLELGETELAQMRRTNIPRTTNSKYHGDEESIEFWFASWLKLPVLSSGSSYMNMITLLKRKRNADQRNSACKFQRVKEAFEGEEEVLIQDVIEMLKDVDF